MNKTLILLILASFVLTSGKTSSKKKQKHPDMITETDKPTKKATLAAVEKFNAAFNRHDVDAVMNMMTEDCIFENTAPSPDGTRIVGAEAVRAYWTKFFTNNPDAVFEAEEVFADGDRCVVRWIYRKTKDGKPWHLRGVDIFKVRNGKVAEKLAYVKG